jgi:hypothetical protein
MKGYIFQEIYRTQGCECHRYQSTKYNVPLCDGVLRLDCHDDRYDSRRTRFYADLYYIYFGLHTMIGQGTLLATNHEFDINTARGILNNKNYKH